MLQNLEVFPWIDVDPEMSFGIRKDAYNSRNKDRQPVVEFNKVTEFAIDNELDLKGINVTEVKHMLAKNQVELRDIKDKL